VWFAAWERASWKRLVVVGLLLGLAMVTKQQYLLVLAPTLLAAWVANLIYYRSAPQRVFLVPGIVAGACFALWQIYMILYLGPATVSENLKQYRQFTAGAALVFNASLMERALDELLSLRVYMSLLFPVVIYGTSLAFPRRRDGHQWFTLWVLVVWNLVWYVVASVSWLRYAFPALSVAALFVARFFQDLTHDFELNVAELWRGLRRREWPAPQWMLRWTLTGWLAVMILVPLAQTGRQIVAPPFNAPAALADYLNAHVSREALIETWEPEMGFLTDHNYHYPPQIRLNTAVGHIWQGGASPAEGYDFVQTERPAYVLVGAFARWVEMYPPELLAERYTRVTTVGAYELYAIREP
jgi:hypothetical protein